MFSVVEKGDNLMLTKLTPVATLSMSLSRCITCQEYVCLQLSQATKRLPP